MYEVKKRVFVSLSKNQKSALCNYLKALVKKMPDFSVEDLWYKFYEDEKYYLEMNSSRFEFLCDIIDEEDFYNDTLIFLRECKKYFDYKKSQEPYLQAQKAFEKQKREFLKEIKMFLFYLLKRFFILRNLEFEKILYRDTSFIVSTI